MGGKKRTTRYKRGIKKGSREGSFCNDSGVYRGARAAAVARDMESSKDFIAERDEVS